MTYGTIKVDTVTFTDAGIDKSVTLSGLVQNPTFSGNVTVTGTLSGVTVTGTTANFTSGNFTNISGGTHTITSGVFAAGSAASPSITFTGDLNTGIYSPGADQVAISTGGSGRLFVDASGNVGVGATPSSWASIKAIQIQSCGLSNYSNTLTNNQTFLTNNAYYNGGWKYIYGDIAAMYEQRYQGGHAWYNASSGSAGSAITFNEAMRLDTSGRLGVGTSSPAYRLSISEASGTQSALGLTSGASTLIIGSQDVGSGRSAISYSNNAGGSNNILSLGFGAVTSGAPANPVISLTQVGNVGIGNNTPDTTLTVGGTNAAIRVQPSNVANAQIFLRHGSIANNSGLEADNTGALAFYANGSERSRIDNSGRLLVGTSTSRNVAAANQRLIQVESTSGDGGISVVRNSSDTTGGRLVLAKSRGTSVGSNTVVQNGDDLGGLIFAGADGNDLQSWGAQILAEVDGAPGVDDLPTRLVFSTTADGASSPTERLRIDSSGRVGIGTSSPSYKLDVSVATNDPTTGSPATGSFVQVAGGTTTVGNGPSIALSNASGAKETFWRMSAVTTSGNNGDLVFNGYNGGANYPERLRITAGGNVGMGTTSPSRQLDVNSTAIFDSNGNGTTTNPSIAIGSTGVGFSYIGSQQLAFLTNSTERARIDSSGRLLVGTSTNLGSAEGYEPRLQVAGSTQGLSIGRYQANNPYGAQLYLQRSKSDTVGGHAVMASGDEVGYISFEGSDGTAFKRAAAITALVDGTPGTNDMPGRLVFSTTADGASSPTERMRINSAGDIGMSSGLTLGNINPSLAGFYSTTAILGTGAGTNAVKFNTSSGKFTYDTSSRLNKDQIEDCPYGIAEIKLLQPRRYYRIDDQRLEVGFVADEVFDVLPEFVPFGPKSAITGNENDTESIPLGVNYEKLTAVLTAALQEAIGEIETLKARLTAAGI